MTDVAADREAAAEDLETRGWGHGRDAKADAWFAGS